MAVYDVDGRAIGGGGGQPIPVKNSSQMEDQSKIYLYVGSESGFSYGHWYTYTDGNWVDSGLYAIGEKGDPGEVPDNIVLYDDSGSGTSTAEAIPLVDTNGVTWYLGVDTSGVPFVGDTNNQVVWVPTQSSYASGDEVSY